MGTPFNPTNPLHNIITDEAGNPVPQKYDPEANSGQGGMVVVSTEDVQKVQQVDTEVEEIVMVHGEGGISHTHLTTKVITFYPNYSTEFDIVGLDYAQRWTEASKYKDKLIAIRNTYDVAVTLQLYDQTREWGGDMIFEVEIPAGANAYITALEYPKLTVPAYNLIFVSKVESLATTGTLTVRFRGRL